jgi:capsular polysaccharide transport system permease protein
MLSLRHRATPDTPLRPVAPVAKSLVQIPTANPVAAPRLVHPAPAADADRPRRHLHLLSFVLVVVLPVVGAAVYWLGIAADQYVAKFRFTLRTAEPAPVVPSWLAGAAATDGRAGLESRLLVDYVRSRAVVDDLSGTLDLRRIYANPAADWWSRLDEPAPIERLVAYWRHQVTADYDPSDQTVAVRVRAFTPRDALRVAQAVVAACQHLVDSLSLQARRDALRQARADADQAKQRLAAVLAQISDLRAREGLIDPGKTAAASAALAARVQQELVSAHTRLSTLETYMRDDSPTISVLKAHIRSLESQQSALAGAASAPDPGGGETLSHALGSFEALESERKFAEDAYRHALVGLDAARANADRQHVYVASFVPPRLPEEPLYPRRWRALGVVALISLAGWGIGCLTLQSIRDHL